MIVKHTTALLGLLLLAGCASLRVDVDVYKGPLINEPDVQLQQVAAQAVAAKPLIQTMIVDMKSGGYDVPAFKPYVTELRTSLEALADMIETDPKAVLILNQLAKDSTTDDATKLTERIVQANDEIARHASAPQVRTKLDLLRARLLTEANPNVATARAEIMQLAQDTKPGGIVQRLALVKNQPQAGTGAEKSELRKSLVEFAERTRWLGNHAKLFLKLLDDEMAAQVAPFTPSPIDEASRKLRKAVETHALILQAIGNSILSQTNEIERMAGLNSAERNSRLKDRERAVWSRVGLARNSILAAVKARDGWIPAFTKANDLTTALQMAETQSGTAATILGEAVTAYTKAAEPLPKVQAAIGKLADAVCKLDEKSDKTVGALIDKCLTKDSADAKLFTSELIGDDKPFKTAATETALNDLREKAQSWLVKLQKWHQDAALFQVWQARLKEEDALLAGLEKVDTANPRETVDLAVARLRGQQVEAALAGDTARRDRIEDAIQVLLAHRAGMVPLVPSSSFLRNSMPATSLSEGINEKDEANMLWQAFIRAFPDTRANGEEKMRQDMDKQYWQPVNRVRVSGGGKTNQVLVKDDVGNWYVKSFDSDKKVVFESMKKLGLYHLAGETASLGALRTRLATTKGLLPDQLKMSDLGIGQATPATEVANDIVVTTQPASTETAANTPNGTASDVYKVAVTRYAKTLHTTYQTLQCDAEAGTENTDECAVGKLTTKALEDLGKKDLKTLDGEVAKLLDTRVKACNPDSQKTDCTPSNPARHTLLKTQAKTLTDALKRLKDDMETISESIGRPLQ